MKCGVCGGENPENMRFCGHCGKPLGDKPAASQNPTGERRCVGCGRPIPWDANACQYCGHDYRRRE
ncbi:MAG: zinc ribbon domain-containing protein [Methanobacteriota archaeon]|nr:MAG: zinc ribbon domain-containing protein [Euryarchaeota archaeon]